MVSAMAQICCEQLAVGYDGHEVLSDLTFSVNAGNYLCVIGENGSGKTTLMKTLLGLLKPVSGKLSYSDGITKNDIGYLPQQTDVQRDFPASVWEIVLSGCQNKMGLKPFYGKKEKTIAMENIRRMDIEDLRLRCYRELSGGQQQRALLARALCSEGSLLVLDEPTAGLDPKAIDEMYTLIDSLRKSGITIIMISHDIANAEKYATHILDVGDRVFFGTIDAYRKEREQNG